MLFKSLIIVLVLLSANIAEAYKSAYGTYPGTGSGFTVDISGTTSPSVTDFQPDACLVKGDLAANAVIRIAGMPANESVQVQGGGVITTGITAFTSNGFTIGNSATVNTGATTYYYVCWATDANNDFSFGNYPGDNALNRNIITSPAFQPEAVFIVQPTTTAVRWRGGAASHTGDSTSVIAATADAANRIDQLNVDGFRVDTGQNATGSTYYYITFKTGVSTIASGSYTANTTTCADNCAVTGLGFQPQFMIIKGASTQAAFFKFAPQAAIDDSCWNNSTCDPNVLQTFDSDGFTYGSSGNVNNNGTLYHWFAMREAAVTAVAIVAPQTIVVD